MKYFVPSILNWKIFKNFWLDLKDIMAENCRAIQNVLITKQMAFFCQIAIFPFTTTIFIHSTIAELRWKKVAHFFFARDSSSI